MDAALSDVVVIDLSRVYAGPYCTMMLGDLGATVMKVEQPGKGDDTRQFGPPYIEGESAYYLGLNRNKYSNTLDFNKPDEKRTSFAIAQECDRSGGKLSSRHNGETGARLRDIACPQSWPDLLLN